MTEEELAESEQNLDAVFEEIHEWLDAEDPDSDIEPGSENLSFEEWAEKDGVSYSQSE